MDIQTLIMPIIVIAFGLFAGGMYVYRKMTAGEAFSWEKFLPTMGLGALASVILYLAAGALPSLDAIFAQIESLAPGGAPSLTVILAALLAIYNQISKGTAPTATVNTPAEQAATIEQPKAGAPIVVSSGTPGFIIPRDGKKLYDGQDGWWVRINPSPEAATLPDDKCYQAVSAHGTVWSGDKDTIKYLVSSPDAAGWRTRNA